MRQQVRRQARRRYVEGEIRVMRDLRRKDRSLWEAERKGGDGVLVPLPAPVRAGWERSFVVRPDVARSPDARIARQLLRLVQNIEHSNRRDFYARDWEHGGRLRPRPHCLKEFDNHDFALVPEDLKKHFLFLHTRRFNRFTRKMEWHRAWVVRSPWRFATKTRPYFVTHRFVPDPDFKTEKAFINDKLYGRFWKHGEYKYRHIIRTEGLAYPRYDYNDVYLREPSTEDLYAD